MTVFWNEGIAETNAGLDILGVRGADQSHEARLTGGITTISARARYLSLLPWFLDEWYRRALRAGRVRHDEDAQRAALRRLEKLVLLSSVAGKSVGENGELRAVLGSDLWAEEVKDIERGAAVDLSSDKGGASLVTYVMPTIQLRLLLDGAPFAVTPAGQEIAEARRQSIGAAPIVDAIFAGGTIDRANAAAVAPHFSVNGLASPEARRERELLSGLVTASSGPLGTTVRWALTAAKAAPVTPPELIAASFRDAVAKEDVPAGPSLAYAQYELLRRVHFALELVLQAICAELLEAGPRSVRSIAKRLCGTGLQPLAERGITRSASRLEDVTIAQLVAQLDLGVLSERPLVRDARRFDPALQVAYATVLLAAAAAAVGAKPALAPPSDSVAARALATMKSDGSRAASELVRELLDFVVERHLFTTFRKMAAGQPCSLRFVSDGRRLQRTDQSTSAGMSGDRLTNVMVMLSDLGFLLREGATFSLTERGEKLLSESVS